MTLTKKDFYLKATKNYDSLSLESKNKLNDCIKEAEYKYYKMEDYKDAHINTHIYIDYNLAFLSSVMSFIPSFIALVATDSPEIVGAFGIGSCIATTYFFSSCSSKSDLSKEFDIKLSENYINDVCGCVTTNPINDMQIDYC